MIKNVLYILSILIFIVACNEGKQINVVYGDSKKTNNENKQVSGSNSNLEETPCITEKIVDNSFLKTFNAKCKYLEV
jgi:hypothetical protein